MMRIKKILSQHRNDFTATMVCEHCGHEAKNTTGYHDSFYHDEVIPSMVCANCKLNSAGELESAKTLDEARAKGITPVHL